MSKTMSRKSSITSIKRDNSKSKNIEAALVMYLYQKSHSPITTRFTGMGLQECDVNSYFWSGRLEQIKEYCEKDVKACIEASKRIY